ncbi:hypothetical protein SGRA_1107 [Saprospira grandis str. Lewin]|uniref:Uncharacterized protein n=1 Tax=Saprospira grandis (strain Lewin) TaxID=984262 RepID=H6L3W0_SAPGL|nr:hypothetical protein SGRA_1107 [Saprospira grandis str. Lewin]
MGPAAGSASPRSAAAMLRGSQVCSALQPPLAALVWPSATPPQRWANRAWGRGFAQKSR